MNLITRINRKFKQIQSSPASPPEYGFFGDYKSWNEVTSFAEGYDSDEILSRVSKSLALVRDGKAIYERDSVLFDSIQYSWPLLSVLLKEIIDNPLKKNALSVIDFGGSLGSTYYQNRSFLGPNIELKWAVVEQPKFVEAGKKAFSNQELCFFSSIESALESHHPASMFICSSVMQYLSSPMDWLKKIVAYGFPSLVFDRTTFSLNDKSVLTLQKVPPAIYRASYPAWFLNESEFLKIILANYNLVCSWEALGGKFPIYKHNASPEWGLDKGFFFKRKTP